MSIDAREPVDRVAERDHRVARWLRAAAEISSLAADDLGAETPEGRWFARDSQRAREAAAVLRTGGPGASGSGLRLVR
jgi:hypothetical protein